jgi:uncharacterized protein (TIGR00369 family)
MTGRELEQGRSDLLKQQFEGSPFSRKLGVEAVRFEEDRAVLRLPYMEENTTVADVVHGGAILTLADIAATAAAWTRVSNALEYRGITVDLSLTFIAAGRSQALTADAQVVKRGGTLTFLEVTIRDEGDEIVAKALATYKLSKVRS